MPYKSDAQRRLFHHLAAQGKIPMAKVREYDAASKGKKLPEFVGHAKKAFGGQIEGKKGVRGPACDYPLDQIPVALDAGEACPRCGYGSAKDVPHKARGGETYAMPKSHSGHGGEVMDSTAYRAHGGYIPLKARGGEMKCARCGEVSGYAHGGEIMHCERCGASMKAMGGEVGGPLHGDMKELYPRKKERGADLDDGRIHAFGRALKLRRQR